jgi:hypothetical protein
LNEELDAVGSLRNWEANTLKDADPNFVVEEDSDEEEGEKPEEKAA